ncbi:MAG: NAD-dependent deacylase [Bauldia sp.]|uniref:NAD-dependent deacylase n=1 Tax=Bauldia sp. TaxID=2575872 RepID=UPI001DA3AD92|nr:NAD-dependent deacylase [Bauldia sp.]MCB1494524.1 NAD-dependent deacylase [Bauldia sp.]
MTTYESIAILTGAGLSAESGLSTFRDKGGIWSKYRIEDVATPEAFARDPRTVLDFYNMRRRRVLDTRPNAGHEALARLEAGFPGTVTTITQNVDPLHERAGTRNLIHMHGEILKALCMHCGTRRRWEVDITVDVTCGACGRTGGLRPDVVWFGEMPYEMDRISEVLEICDLFLSIGTSGNVYPAAGFAARALAAGAHTVELNLEPSKQNDLFAEAVHGKASEVVPDYVDRLLGG